MRWKWNMLIKKTVYICGKKTLHWRIFCSHRNRCVPAGVWIIKISHSHHSEYYLFAITRHGHTVVWPGDQCCKGDASSQWEKANNHTPLTTPTPLNRQSLNIAHVITSTTSPQMPHMVKVAPGDTSPHIAKVTIHFFKISSLYANLSTDLELRPLNRFWHAIHQQTCIHAG